METHMTSSEPQFLCLSCGAGLDGGPVVFWCARCGRRVQAAAVDVGHRPPGSPGRAV
jgi:predicted RNA-binding Zn-ribbon protein involved in translation (DUF1610 family)